MALAATMSETSFIPGSTALERPLQSPLQLTKADWQAFFREVAYYSFLPFWSQDTRQRIRLAGTDDLNQRDWKETFSLFLTDSEGKKRFNRRGAVNQGILWGSWGLVMGGIFLAACNYGSDGGGTNPPPGETDVNSVCSNLLHLADLSAAHSAVISPEALAAAQNGDLSLASEQIDCLDVSGGVDFNLSSEGITSGDLIVAQTLRIEGNDFHPMLSILSAAEPVDDGSGGQPEGFIVQQFSAKDLEIRQNNGSLTVDLPAAALDLDSGAVTLDPTEMAKLTVINGDGGKTFNLTLPDGQVLTLSEEQAGKLSFISLIEPNLDAAFAAQNEVLLNQVEGQNLATAGTEYALPEEVRAQLLQHGGAPILVVASGTAGVWDGASGQAAVMLPDHFVTGEILDGSSNGEVSYTLGDHVSSEGLWKFDLPDGILATAFVAKDGNQWGLASGTVAVWFFTDESKGGGVQILNPDNPLRIIWDADNTGKLDFNGSVLTLTITDPTGHADVQTVDLAVQKILSSDQLSKMSEAQKLNFAPPTEGLSKTEVYLGGSVVLYRDENLAVQSGYDLLTGEWLNQEQVYGTMLEGASLTPDNTWPTSHSPDNNVEAIRGVFAIFPDPDVEIKQSIIVDGEQMVVVGKNVIFYDINVVGGQAIIHKALAPLSIENPSGEFLSGFGCDCGEADFPQLGTTYRLTYTQKLFISGFPKGTEGWYSALAYWYFLDYNIDSRMRSGEVFDWPEDYILPSYYYVQRKP